ncbi:MAG: ABC transporter permease [Candidatus Krumholzibacteriota bacterium]|nr:ABC transporter permease [Candidatus Krumholzibacteriota bacterium]
MTDDIVNIISAEKYKLLRRRSSAAMLFGVVILSVLLFLSVDLAAQRDWIGIPSGFYLASVAIGWMVNIIALLTIMIVAFQISGEFALGTVKPAWTRPIRRSAWFVGKLISVSAVSSVLFMISFATITLLASMKYGFSDLMEKDYLVHAFSALAGRYILASFLTLVSFWALAAVTAMFAACFVRPGSTIAVTVVLSFLMSVIAIFRQAAPFLLSSALSMPFQQMKMMSKGLPVPLEWNDLTWQTMACASAYLILAVVSGLIIINKKEVTF